MRKPLERIVIENIHPQIEAGRYFVKRSIGEKIKVTADIFAEGSYKINADLLWRKQKNRKWNRTPMILMGNDSWESEFVPEEIGIYEYTIEAWIDHFATWKEYILRKINAGSFASIDVDTGMIILKKVKDIANEEEYKFIDGLITSITKLNASSTAKFFETLSVNEIPNYYFGLDSIYQSPYKLFVNVKRKKALFSTWYEFFPRSTSKNGKHGTFLDCISLLTEIKQMGFDTIYFPPIHPIGYISRKGFNNTVAPNCEEFPGCPWAIGNKKGGHDAIHPELGSLADFRKLIKNAADMEIEIAMDLAFQCSPDHPYLKSHPEWFLWRSDGTVQFAENPPKKYEDIVPFNFDNWNWEALWSELKRVVIYWVDNGIKIFRVDNPHTKPFPFWEWLIEEVNQYDPDVLFLSEAFTRPKVMNQLAKVGFDQSYTYFTWRNTKHEIQTYINEIIYTQTREFFRPNFWPNTPDILPETLQYGGRVAHIARYILAATLSSNIGIYGPVYELCIHKGMEHKEEYLDSEKYEIKQWDRSKSPNIIEIISIINRIRNENHVLQTTWNTEFIETENNFLIAYIKKDELNKGEDLLVIVNLDFHNTQAGMVNLPLQKLKIEEGKSFLVEDQLTKEKYIWTGPRNYVELNPNILPAHIFKIYRELRQENQFDYYI